MSCNRCEVCHGVPGGSGRVFLHSPTPVLQTKLDGLVRSAGAVPSPDTRDFEVASFSEFLERFLKQPSWSALEKRDVQALFLPTGQELNFENSLETRSLARWESLLNAGFLVDILQNERLVSHFHPIWDLKTQTLFGHECLIRGRDSAGNLISPGRLFSTASETDLTFNLDRQARQSALKAAASFDGTTKLFINFVPTAIYDPVFCLETTVSLAHQLGITPDRIVFEVIETEEVEDWKHPRRAGSGPGPRSPSPRRPGRGRSWRTRCRWRRSR